MIISYLIHDTSTLLACSMTCFAWYLATVPHLHYSLTTDENAVPREDGKYRWPRPLQESYKLGLLPLVRRFRVRRESSTFGPGHLNQLTLQDFSALTNLQELGVDGLQISSLMPNIRRCFGHFSPTLRFLALGNPEGSWRQIIYFIGLFPNLQDLKLCNTSPGGELENEADLVPLSVPPLDGRLTLTCLTGRSIVKEMIACFGGLRFRHMDLFMVWGVRLLLEACASTLEVLRLYPTDPYGEYHFNREEDPTDSSQPFTGDEQAARGAWDLSRNKALRTLETTAESMVFSEASPRFLSNVLSTVTSPRPLEVVVIYWESDVDRIIWFWSKPISVRLAPSEMTAGNALHHQKRFEQFREMHRVRDFQLVLCADVLDCAVKDAVWLLEAIVGTERSKGGLDYFSCPPVVISEMRTPRTRVLDSHTGSTARPDVRASAL